MKKIDLHTHSYYSDGSLSPKEIILKASSEGVDVIALTDHDTVDGVLEAEEAAKDTGIRLIKGIEISSFDEDIRSIHVLGLNLKDLASFSNLQKKNRASRKVRNEAIVEGVNKKYSFDVRFKDIEDTYKGTIGGGNLCRYYVDNGLAPSYDQASKMFKEFKNIPYGIHIKDAINAIHNAGGIAFVAHPCDLKRSDEELLQKFKTFKEYGLDGIECFHTKHSPEQTAYYLDIAKNLNLLISGGSDFHGQIKPNVKFAYGKSETLLVDESYLDWL